MPSKRVYTTLSQNEMRRLERLSRKLGLDYSSTLRYSMLRTADAEGVTEDSANSRKRA